MQGRGKELATAGLGVAGAVIGQRERQHDGEPEETGRDDELGAARAVFAVHEEKNNQAHFNGGDGKSENDVPAAQIDLGGFDFDRVSDPMDEMMLPGALKYGGIDGFAALCTHGRTLLTGARRDTDSYPRAAGTNSLSLRVETTGYEDLVDWLEQR